MRLIRYLPLCSAVICGLTLLRPLSAQEAGSNVSARSAAAEYLVASGLEEVGRLALRLNERVFVDQMTKGDTGRVRDSVRAFAARYVPWDSVRNDAVGLLTEQCTENELRDMLAFLRTGGGSVYATALTDAARRYASSDLPVDTVRLRFARALDDVRPTSQELAEIGHFAGTPLGQKLFRLPMEIVTLGNREFIARLRPRLPVLQAMVESTVPQDSRREVDLSQPRVAARAPRNTSDQPYFEFKLNKPVTPIPDTVKLRYPAQLRAANVEGEVLLQFVVDTNGRVDTSRVKVLRSSHELFTAAVKEVLPRLRFTPAEVGRRKVRELVQQPFTFSLDRKTSAVTKP